jgi:hypothetical protein
MLAALVHATLIARLWRHVLVPTALNQDSGVEGTSFLD